MSVFVLWNLGALLGSGLGDPGRYGLDAMFPAAFLALLAPQLRQERAPVMALAGGLIAVQTLGDDGRLVLDARLPALAVAALCVWRRLPIVVTVLAAAATAAGLRAL